MSTEIATTINQALDYPTIREQREEDIYKPIAMIIGRTYALCGQQVDKENLKFMARELGRSVSERFAGLTIPEIGIALDRGAKKDYGEYFGLNIVTFLDWCRAYTHSEARIKAMESKAIAALPEKVPPTPEEIEKKSRDSAIDCFERYASGKKHRFGWVFILEGVYDYLSEKSLLQIEPAKKWEFMEEAKRLEEQEDRDSAMKSRRRGFARPIGSVIEDIKIEISENRVIRRAKQLSVEYYFDGLIKSGTELKDLIPPIR